MWPCTKRFLCPIYHRYMWSCIKRFLCPIYHKCKWPCIRRFLCPIINISGTSATNTRLKGFVTRTCSQSGNESTRQAHTHIHTHLFCCWCQVSQIRQPARRPDTHTHLFCCWCQVSQNQWPAGLSLSWDALQVTSHPAGCRYVCVIQWEHRGC